MSQQNLNQVPLLDDRHPDTTTWWETVKTNLDKLRALINDYHPAIGLGRNIPMPITAGRAEDACEVVRNRIRKTSFSNPLEEFNEAVRNQNPTIVYSILSDVWFGVPESTSCWQLEGFPELVDLLDSPPE